MNESSYNERLFGRGIRKKLHLGRYLWVSKEVNNLESKVSSVFELGCFDGKLIDWLQENNIRYLGADANWEGGIDLAKRKYANSSGDYSFLESQSVDTLPRMNSEFDVSVCMETLEHIAPELVDDYLERLSLITRDSVFITVPNEVGIVFFAKTIVKFFLGGSRNYTLKEFFYHCIGLTEKVTLPKGKGGHKGFGYHPFIDQVSTHFKIVKVEGIPFSFLPPFLNFGVGIVGVPKRHAVSDEVQRAV